MKKPELLAPAGSLESLETALLYGADAVYIGGELFSLRAKARNFDREEIQKAAELCHASAAKLYVAVNIIGHDSHFEGLGEYLQFLESAGVDALIMADAGMIMTARSAVPNMPIHLSTQASATNSETFCFWHQNGISRIVAARELSLEELSYIRAHTPKELEMEAFVHGAMCMSISGRCLLSAYMAGRDANLGECAQPCRWQYRLVEEMRPGEYFPVMEGEEGTYIFNSKDLCMIEHLPELLGAGVESFKIEGRMKTPLYVAMVTKIYREAIDDYAADPSLYEAKKPSYLSMLSKVSHRSYSTGFYFGAPDESGQIYESVAYDKELSFGARILSCERALPDGLLLVEQRGRFFQGEEVFLLPFEGEQVPFRIEKIFATNDPHSGALPEPVMERESAPHAKERLFIKAPLSICQEAKPGMIIALSQ